MKTQSLQLCHYIPVSLKQCLGWQLMGERYWCLSVGLEYKSVVMLPSLTVVVVSRKDILVFDTSCVNFIDGWILLAWSKNSSNSLSLSIHFMSTSSINRNHERGYFSDERSNRSSRSPWKCWHRRVPFWFPYLSNLFEDSGFREK